MRRSGADLHPARSITSLSVLVLCCLVFSARADETCSGHGHLDASTGECFCDNPWPTDQERGWTGTTCSIPVYPGTHDGNDMTAGCGGCSSLEAGSWVCFAVALPWK